MFGAAFLVVGGFDCANLLGHLISYSSQIILEPVNLLGVSRVTNGFEQPTCLVACHSSYLCTCLRLKLNMGTPFKEYGGA